MSSFWTLNNAPSIVVSIPSCTIEPEPDIEESSLSKEIPEWYSAIVAALLPYSAIPYSDTADWLKVNGKLK